MKKTILLLLAGLLVACGPSKVGLEQYDAQTASQIFSAADQALLKGDYKAAIERYEALQALYPASDYAEQTMLNLIYAYYRQRDYESVTSAVDRYLHWYPQGAHADYAYYMQALAAYQRNLSFLARYVHVDMAKQNMNDLTQALADFNELLTRFPNSPYAADAHQHVLFLTDNLAKHQLEIAYYYYARKAWLAAAERAAIVVNTYPGTPQVEPALVVMIKSYQQLGLNAQRQQAINVFKANYPTKLSELEKPLKKLVN